MSDTKSPSSQGGGASPDPDPRFRFLVLGAPQSGSASLSQVGAETASVQRYMRGMRFEEALGSGQQNNTTVAAAKQAVSSLLASPALFLVVFFLGHGVPETGDWLFADGAVSFDLIRAYWDIATQVHPKKQLLVVAHCCHSGAWVASAKTHGVTFLLQASCAATETIFDGTFVQHWLRLQGGLITHEKALAAVKRNCCAYIPPTFAAAHVHAAALHAGVPFLTADEVGILSTLRQGGVDAYARSLPPAEAVASATATAAITGTTATAASGSGSGGAIALSSLQSFTSMANVFGGALSPMAPGDGDAEGKDTHTPSAAAGNGRIGAGAGTAAGLGIGGMHLTYPDPAFGGPTTDSNKYAADNILASLKRADLVRHKYGSRGDHAYLEVVVNKHFRMVVQIAVDAFAAAANATDPPSPSLAERAPTLTSKRADALTIAELLQLELIAKAGDVFEKLPDQYKHSAILGPEYARDKPFGILCQLAAARFVSSWDEVEIHLHQLCQALLYIGDPRDHTPALPPILRLLFDTFSDSSNNVEDSDASRWFESTRQNFKGMLFSRADAVREVNDPESAFTVIWRLPTPGIMDNQCRALTSRNLTCTYRGGPGADACHDALVDQRTFEAPSQRRARGNAIHSSSPLLSPSPVLSPVISVVLPPNASASAATATAAAAAGATAATSNSATASPPSTVSSLASAQAAAGSAGTVGSISGSFLGSPHPSPSPSISSLRDLKTSLAIDDLDGAAGGVSGAAFVSSSGSSWKQRGAFVGSKHLNLYFMKPEIERAAELWNTAHGIPNATSTSATSTNTIAEGVAGSGGSSAGGAIASAPAAVLPVLRSAEVIAAQQNLGRAESLRAYRTRTSDAETQQQIAPFYVSAQSGITAAAQQFAFTTAANSAIASASTSTPGTEAGTPITGGTAPSTPHLKPLSSSSSASASLSIASASNSGSGSGSGSGSAAQAPAVGASASTTTLASPLTAHGSGAASTAAVASTAAGVGVWVQQPAASGNGPATALPKAAIG